MRASEITVTCYGPDAKTALEQVFVELLAALPDPNDEPMAVQVRVSPHAVEPDPADPTLSTPDPSQPLDGARYVAEGKVWFRRGSASALPRGLVTRRVVVLPPAVPASGGAPEES